MDPLSVSACLIGVVDVAIRTSSAIMKYAKETKHASSDRKLLAEETRFLSKLLERLRDRAQTARQDEEWLNDHKEIVRQFEAAYDDLAMAVKFDTVTGKIREESRFQHVKTISKWSFTKSEVYSLLERVTRLQQYANLLLADDQHTLLERIDQKQHEALEQELKSSVSSWLSPLQMSQIHQTHSDRAEKGSGRWFLTDAAFRAWKERPEARLWCFGIPGAGKTVMASIIINHLRQNRPERSKGRVGITFLYLKYNEPEQTLESVLASLLKQLVHEMDAIPPALLDLYEHHNDRNTSLTTDEVSTVLSATIEDHDEVFCVIDALDECHEDLRWGLVERLEKLGPNFRVLITSRYLDIIAEELEHFERFEIRANKADIELFIEHQIRRNRNLRKTVERSPSLLGDIKQGVVNTAQNMFLLARLHVESLASAAGLSVKHVRNKLRTLPTTLTGTYDDAMERIQNQEPDHKLFALKAMAWVCYAFRSLSLKELQHALVIEPGDTELDKDMLMDGQSITSLCAGLVIVDQRTSVVNLVHYSAKTYFEDIRHIHFPEFHAKITLVCATYLTLDSLKGAKIWEIVQEYPLACYAAQYMGDHARSSPEEALEPSILHMICNLLSHPDKRRPLLSLLDGLDLIRDGFYSDGPPLTRNNTGALLDPSVEMEMSDTLESVLDLTDHGESDSSSFTSSSSSATPTSSDTVTGTVDGGGDEEVWGTEIKSSRIPEVTALHLAASMGLAKIASLLLKETTNIDAVDETGKTALALALERGFEKAVEFLVNSGACVDLSHEHGRGVLLLVTERNWYHAGDIIVEKAGIMAKESTSAGTHDRISLPIAAYQGDVKEVTRLVSKGNLNLQTEDHNVGASAVFLAVEKDLIHMVEVLLAFGVDVNSKDDMGQTSLHRATRCKSEAMVKLLLKSEAKVDEKADDGRTAWSANLRSGATKVLQLLLDAGADPSTVGQQNVSELYTAGKEGEIEVVKYMLESGTNPSIHQAYHWVPLHWSAAYGHFQCTKLLIEAGAELSHSSDQRVTPLDLADQADQTEIVELLTKVGARYYKDIEPPTYLPTLDNIEKDGEWVSLPRVNDENSELKIPSDGKLRLVYDKVLIRTLKKRSAVGQFVYPSGTEGPQENIYHVSHFLETSSNSIGIRHSPGRSENWEYSKNPWQFDREDMLYEVLRIKSDYQEFELRGKQQSALPGTIRMHRDWTGGWKVRHNKPDNTTATTKSYLLRTTSDWSSNKCMDCRWLGDEGVLLGRSGWEDGTPWITFEPGAERKVLDVAVTCWIVKLWSETAALQRREK